VKRPLPAHRGFWFAVSLSAITSSIGLLGGLGLQSTQNSLVAFAPLLIALPALHAASSNYAATIAAHLSDPKMYPERMRRLIIALAVSTPITVLGVSAMSLLIAKLEGNTPALGQARKYIIFYAVLLSSVVLIIFVGSYIANKILQKRQINSDDVLINVTNSAASVLLLLGFAIAAHFYF
jgi:cation transporter-like permease